MLDRDDLFPLISLCVGVCAILIITAGLFAASLKKTELKIEAIKNGASAAVLVCAFTDNTALQTQCIDVK